MYNVTEPPGKQELGITMPRRKSSRRSATENKRTDLPQELSFGFKWTSEDNGRLLVRSSDTQPGVDKVAAFDIDWTLTSTKSGRTFTTGPNDWVWLYDCVPDKLRYLYEEGYRIVFFTNQAGIEKNRTSSKDVMERVDGMCHDLSIPTYCFVSTGRNYYRKPSTGMWDMFEKSYNQGVTVERTCSLYVGDAAGRAKAWAKDKPKDFSCSDRMFAANVGIAFFTPEEYFLDKAPAPFDWRSTNPVHYLTEAESNTMLDAYHTENTELIIMVGPPTSGKSTFCWRYLQPYGYSVVNRDTLSKYKMAKAIQESLSDGVSVVVDSTAASVEAREEFTRHAQQTSVPCRCFMMDIPFDLAHHMNMFRMNRSKGRVCRVLDAGYNAYKKSYQLPTKEEGFTEILKIPFVPHFDNKDNLSVFKQWTNS